MELNLSHNNLTHIEQDTFSGNERLQVSIFQKKYYLYKNLVEIVNCLFTLHILHFQTLTLSNNRIATLSPYVFPLLKHLKSIDLSHNLIDEVQRNTFENLGFLTK